MHLSRSARRLTALLLALCLQFQALAALAMPCAHARAGMEPAAHAGCHGVKAEHRTMDAKAHFSCAKCALALAVFAYPPPTAGQSQPVAPMNPVLSGHLQGHFYDFVPPPLRRPPTPDLV